MAQKEDSINQSCIKDRDRDSEQPISIAEKRRRSEPKALRVTLKLPVIIRLMTEKENRAKTGYPQHEDYCLPVQRV